MQQSQWLVDLVKAKLATPYANDLRGRALGAVEGVVTSVDDPENRGRVRVALDSKGGEVETIWMPVANSIVGRQADTLVGKRVLVSPINGNLHMLRVVDVLDTGTALSARSPVYTTELPPCNQDNLGAIVVHNQPGRECRACICLPSGWKTLAKDSGS